MNPLFVLVLIVLVGTHILQTWAEVLNLASLRSSLPREFRDVYDVQTYRSSQEYTRARAKLDLLSSSLGLAALLSFILASGLQWLDALIQSLDLPSVPTGVIFLGLLAMAADIMGLPFQIYNTFVLEERFGFNRTTLSIFAKDKLKQFVLALLIGGSCLAAVIAFLNAFPHWGWVLAWVGLVLIMLGLQSIAPSWILPLFNTFTPLEDGELKQKILEYAKQNGVAIQDITVMDGSRRSAKSNAFFTGFGRKKRIALFDTLIKKHPQQELVAVLAHEIGHSKLNHVSKKLILSALQMGLLLGLLSVLLRYEPLFQAFGLEQASVHAGLFIFLLLYTPVSQLLAIGTQYISRRHEFEADAFAARTTGHPEMLVQALQRLSEENLSNLTPHPLKVWLEYSHPPVTERIRALLRL